MQGNNIVSAVFDSQSEAQRAIEELRSAGVSNSAISVIGKQDGDNRATETTGGGDRVDDGKEPASFIAKAAAGSGIGALLGVAALAIPGVGPLVAAGAIAEAAVGGAAVTGTVIGAAAGGVADLLTKHGVSDEDARYYGDRIDQGGIFVSVDTRAAGIDHDRVEDILYNAGGHSSSRARSTTASTSY